MTTYTIQINNIYEPSKMRQVKVEGTDPMLVHKKIYLSLKRDEEIERIVDNRNKLVYDLDRGFNKL